MLLEKGMYVKFIGEEKGGEVDCVPPFQEKPCPRPRGCRKADIEGAAKSFLKNISKQ